jgi:hypothetical protein
MTWKNLNPTWEYIYASATDRARQVQRFNEKLYKFYLLSDKVTQADIWRYVSVYLHGGFYADMDSICSMPLDYMLEQYRINEEIVATSPNNQEGLNNANFGAIQGSEILQSVIKGVIDMHENLDYYNILIRSESKEDFWDCIKKEIRTSPYNYTQELNSSLDKVCFADDWCHHGKDLKHRLDIDHTVDYYGKVVLYSTLAVEKGWRTYYS